MTRKPRRITGDLGFLLLFGLVVCAFFHRLFIGDRLYASDFFQTFVPLRTILAEAWSHGFPTWTGKLGNGSPILANPAYGTLYPLNLLYLGADPARSMTILTLLHVLCGGLGAWLLAHRWEMSRASCWIAAAGFALSGPVLSATAYPNLCWPLAWLPFAILAHEEAVRGRAWRGIAGLGFVWFSMISMGDPVVLLSALAGSALLVVRDIARDPPDRSWRRQLTRSLLPPGAAGLISLILASPLLVAVARYFPYSVRAAGFKTEAIVLWSFHPLLLAGVILPDPYGDPSRGGPDGFWASALVGDRGRPLLAGFYVGGLIVALAILGALRRSPHRATLLAWLGLLFTLALGKYGPIYSLAGDVNGFDGLRYPMKWLVPAMLPLSLLAASGLDHLKESASTVGVSRRGALVFLLVLLFLAALSVASMAGLERKIALLAARPELRIGGVPIELYVRTTWLQATARSAIPLALALIALVFLTRARAAGWVVPVVAALATLDMTLANHRLAPTVAGDFYDVPEAARVILQDPAGCVRVFVDEDGRGSQEGARSQRESLASYVAASTGLSMAFNGDTEAFSPVIYARAGVLIREAPLREKLMLLGAAGATHIVTFRTPEGPLREPLVAISGSFTRPLLVYRNPFAIPRVRIVSRLTSYVADDGFIRAVLSAPDDLFRRTALVEEHELLSSGLPPDAFSAEGGTAAVVTDDGGSLVVQTEGPGGFLIVSDTLAPGWTARLDGEPVPLVRVDLAFRATPVPAGSHRVEMSYNPW